MMNQINAILKNRYTLDDIIYLLSIDDENDLEILFQESSKICEQNFGKSVYLRGIIEFSNYCRKNCNYCGIRLNNKNLNRYRIDMNDIIQLGINAFKDGFHTIILQSGEDISYDNKLLYIIREIKKNVDIAITVSIGERNFEFYEKLKQAGADRFLLRIETTDEKLFKTLHPDDDLNYRKECLYNLKKIGFEVGTGIMVGLPGQTLKSIAEDIIFFKEFDADMVGVGPFIPHPNTPLSTANQGSFNLTLKVIAITRLLLNNTNIPATTAMGTVHPNGREMALKIGANVIMPNYTPQKFRPLYKLYDNKICIFENAENCKLCTEQIAKRAGKHIVISKGDRKK